MEQRAEGREKRAWGEEERAWGEEERVWNRRHSKLENVKNEFKIVINRVFVKCGFSLCSLHFALTKI